MADLNIDSFNEQMNELRRTMGTLDRATKSTSERMALVANVFADAGRTLGGFVLTVGQGQTKFSSFNSMIDFSTRTLSTFASKIPVIGGLITASLEATAAAAKEVTRVMDEVDTVFTEFGRVGALTARGIEGVRTQFAASGQSLQSFRQTVLENSISFARMGGLVSQGADTFFNSVGKLANPADSAGDSLRRLGFSTDDIVETGAAYMRQQILLGRTEQLNQRTLTTGTQELATEMDKLSKLTGAQRKQLQEQREAALREGVFGAAMREMELEGRTEQAKAIQAVNAALENLVSPQVAKGFRDLASGFPKSDEARKLAQSTGGAAQAILEDLKSGSIGSLEAIQRLREAAKGLNLSVQQFAKVGGDEAGVYLAAYEQQLLSTIPELKDAADLEKKLNEIREKQQSAQNETTNTFIQAKKELEVLNRQINLLSFSAIPGMSVAIQTFTEFVNNMVTRLAGVFGMTPEQLGMPARAGARGGGGAAAGAGAGAAGGGAGAGAGAAGGGGVPGARAIQSSTVYQNLRREGKSAPEAYELARTQLQGLETTRAENRAALQDILNLIGRAESQNNYNAVYPNTVEPNLTNMTVAEVLQLQRQRVNQGQPSSAVGKYQIINRTLQGLINNGILSLEDRFDSSTQDRAAIALLEQAGLSQYQSGQLSGGSFGDNLAQIFAGIPLANGRSAYEGPLNRAVISRREVTDVLGARYGSIMSGPIRGYQTTLHGTEAVIPLSGGRSIPIEMPAFTENIRRLADIMLDQTSRFDDLIDMMRVNNNLTKDMARYQRA